MRIGKKSRVCRGCLLVALGGLVGLTASFFVRVPPSALLASWAAGALGLGYTVTRRSPARARTPKIISRFFPTLVIAFAFGRAVQLGPMGCAMAVASLLPLFSIVALYRRRGPDRRPCASCAERLQAAPCRGILPIVRRERAFRRLAGQWLAGVGL